MSPHVIVARVESDEVEGVFLRREEVLLQCACIAPLHAARIIDI